MKFLSIFREKRIKPAWEFRTEGNLWRFLFSESGRIVGEDRVQAAKTAHFFCLNELSGKVLWSGLEFEEKWWIGIEAIDGGIVYFHEYVKPDFPQHFKIKAVDIETGKLLWRNDEMQPVFVASGKIFAVKDLFEKRIYYQLNGATGELEREFPEGENVNLDRKVQAGYQDLLFPEVLEENSENCEGLIETIRSHCDLKKVEGKVEFIRRGNLLFFNYHERVKGRSAEELYLNNYLKVVNVDRKHLLLSELLNEGAPAPTPDSFFFKGGQLFFIKNKNTLVAFRLEEFEKRD